MLWIIASIFFVLSVALFIFLLWEKLPPVRAGSLAVGELVNLLTAVLTLVGLAIALGSLYVAVVAYQKSVKDSEEHRKNLDASRAQLQAVVDAASKQQEILSKNLETSKIQQELLSKNLEISQSQFNLVDQQRKEELERRARKPITEIALRTTAYTKTLADLEKLPEIDFSLEKGKPWSRLVFLVANKGNIEIIKPIIRIVASPNTVFVDKADFRIHERMDHNSFQFAGPIINDIDPVQIADGSYSFPVDITVPESVSAFDLSFSIQGKNLVRQFHTLHFKVRRSPS